MVPFRLRFSGNRTPEAAEFYICFDIRQVFNYKQRYDDYNGFERKGITGLRSVGIC